MLWGGAFNPLIVVDGRDIASRLIDLYEVDVLYAIGDDSESKSFVDSFAALAWPFGSLPLLRSAGEWRRDFSLSLVDVRQILASLRQPPPLGERPRFLGIYPSWRDDDDIADPLLVTFGAYPATDLGDVFRSEFDTLYPEGRYPISPNNLLTPELAGDITPLRLTGFNLGPDRGGPLDRGLFLGDGSDFDDLVTYWNVRAAGHKAVFADVRPQVAARQHDFLAAHISYLLARANGAPKGQEWRYRIVLWERIERKLPADILDGIPIIRSLITELSWNGLNIQPATMTSVSERTVGDLSSEFGRPTLSIRLGVDAKVFSSSSRDQFSVAALSSLALYGAEADDHTFAVYNIRGLDDYYSREMLLQPHTARVGPDGVGIITHSGSEFLTVRSLSSSALIEQVFAAFGIAIRTSRAGLVTKRLIKQMGGLDRCRVFRIAGVRDLIRDFSASQWFTYGEAIRRISRGFKSYEDPFIAARDPGKLTPNDAFAFLIEKGVLRAGLEFRCPSCQLTFWVSLDDAKSHANCEFCNTRFNATTQLRDKNGWKYRRSGLFGRDDHQEGGIPVTLSLLGLHAATGRSATDESTVFTTGVEITSANAPPCEIDFVCLTQEARGRPQLVLGEAKEKSEITEVDVANLRRVASAFPRERLDVYVAFGKTGNFSQDELGRCLDSEGTRPHRSIVLSCEELQSQFHLDTRDLPEHLRHDRSVSGLAEITEARYRSRLGSVHPGS